MLLLVLLFFLICLFAVLPQNSYQSWVQSAVGVFFFKFACVFNNIGGKCGRKDFCVVSWRTVIVSHHTGGKK